MDVDAADSSSFRFKPLSAKSTLVVLLLLLVVVVVVLLRSVVFVG